MNRQQVIEKAADALIKNSPIAFLRATKYLMETEGKDWYVPYHFTSFMALRNMFRREVCLDKDLPDSKNWDDYYVDAVEFAVRRKYVVLEES